jgi:geranylgeranyl diphosphate synthase type II
MFKIRSSMNLNAYLASVDRALDRLLPKDKAKAPTTHKTKRYSLFAGGKQLRPILSLAAATEGQE